MAYETTNNKVFDLLIKDKKDFSNWIKMKEEAQKILGIDDEQINKKKKPIINKDKEKFLNPPKSPGCTASFISQGMSSEEAQKHCDNLWKNELRRRDSGRTVPA
jgi:hypothetical protein